MWGIAAKLIGKFGGWALSAVFLFLWVRAEKAETEAIEAANTRTAVAVAEAEQITREAVTASLQREIELQKTLRRASQIAFENVSRASSAAQAEVGRANLRIRELELESFDENDLPDSAACLNVYLPGRLLYTNDCREAGAGGGQGDRICAGPESLNPADSAFSVITYGDAMRLWARDRATIITLNSQLRQIEELTDETLTP